MHETCFQDFYSIFVLERASTDLLIFYLIFTQNLCSFCADLGSFN